MRLEKVCEMGASRAWGPHGKWKDKFRQRGCSGDSPQGGAGAWRSKHRSLELQRRKRAAALESRAGGYLELSGDRLRTLLTSLKRQQENGPPTVPQAQGDAILPGQESQEREACFSTALKGKHSSWGSYPQE